MVLDSAVQRDFRTVAIAAREIKINNKCVTRAKAFLRHIGTTHNIRDAKAGRRHQESRKRVDMYTPSCIRKSTSQSATKHISRNKFQHIELLIQAFKLLAVNQRVTHDKDEQHDQAATTTARHCTAACKHHIHGHGSTMTSGYATAMLQ